MLIYALLLASCAIIARTLCNPQSDFAVLILLAAFCYAPVAGVLRVLQRLARSSGKGPAILIEILLLSGSLFLARPGNLSALILLHLNLISMLVLILMERPMRERAGFGFLSLIGTFLFLSVGNELAGSGVSVEWDNPGASGSFQTITFLLERSGRKFDEVEVGCEYPWLSFHDFDRDGVPDIVITCWHSKKLDSILSLAPPEKSIVIGLREPPGEPPRFMVLQANDYQRSQYLL